MITVQLSLLLHLNRIRREEKVYRNLANLYCLIISKSLSILDQNSIRDDQIRWEYVKFEIRQFSIIFSKNLSKYFNAQREVLEKELKDFEKSGS